MRASSRAPSACSPRRSTQAVAARRHAAGARHDVERAALRVLSDPAGADRLLGEVEAAIPCSRSLATTGRSPGWWLLGSRLGPLEGPVRRVAEEALERALALRGRGGDRRQEAEILGQLGFAALFGPTPVPRRRSSAAGRSSRGGRANRSSSRRAPLPRRAGGPARRLRRGAGMPSAVARALFEELGLRLAAQVSTLRVGDIELLVGDYRRRRAELRAGLSRSTQMGERGYRSSVAAFLARGALRPGPARRGRGAGAASRAGRVGGRHLDADAARGTRAKVLARRGTIARPSCSGATPSTLLEGTDGLDLAEARCSTSPRCLARRRRDEASPAAEAALALFEREGERGRRRGSRRLARGRDSGGVTPLEGRAGPAS